MSKPTVHVIAMLVTSGHDPEVNTVSIRYATASGEEIELIVPPRQALETIAALEDQLGRIGPRHRSSEPD